MARVVADTHALLWMLKGTLRERSQGGADAIEQALDTKALCVSIGSFLDLRYLVDSGRLAEQALNDARAIVNSVAAVAAIELSREQLEGDLMPRTDDAEVAASSVATSPARLPRKRTSACQPSRVSIR